MTPSEQPLRAGADSVSVDVLVLEVVVVGELEAVVGVEVVGAGLSFLILGSFGMLIVIWAAST